MSLFRQKMNLHQILTGLMILFFGSLVYIVDRPPEQTYFISRCMPEISLHHILPNFFGVLGNSFADFSHVFAFIMITAGILSCGARGYFLISVSWFFVDSLFEIGQKFSETAMNLIPGWFHTIPLLKSTPRFFQNGTFDWLDLAAILIGAVSACLTLQITQSVKNKTAVKPHKQSRQSPLVNV